MKFEELEFRNTGGIIAHKSARHMFPNGYGVSVIRGPYTYGGEDGLYELAVLRGNEIVYDTPITDDVCGYLTPEQVSSLLEQVEALPQVQS